MSWFTRRRGSRFPADMTERLDVLGRFSLDRTTSGIDFDQVYDRCIATFRSDARADPDGFLADLRVVIAEDTSGFVTYGASSLMVELLGYSLRTTDAHALMDAGIAFKRERHLPSACLTGYEWKRWLEVNGPGTWWTSGGGDQAPV